MQRHHLLPCQLLSRRGFARMVGHLGPQRIGFDDFRRNGLLLPARDDAALRMALPLHRGPHRDYNAMVIERVGQIEAAWAADRVRDADAAGQTALWRLALLQRALARRLLDPPRAPFVLNRTRLGEGYDFTELDAMAEPLWGATQEVLAERSAFAA